MSIEYAILGLLSLHPLTGYDIKKMFAGSAALYWSDNNNQIYRGLVNLHQQDLVTREVQLQEKAPSRKVYSITEKGRAELQKWVLSAPEPPQLKNPFLIQLAWADQLSPGELDSLLAKYEDELQMMSLMCRMQERQIEKAKGIQHSETYLNLSLARTKREALLWKAILERWSVFYENELGWVRGLRKELGEE
jgi:PadR family transcriptional regulator, regulatory protein AphA